MARRADSAAPVAGPSSKPTSKRKAQARPEPPIFQDDIEHVLDSDGNDDAPKPVKKKTKGMVKGKAKELSTEETDGVQVIEDSDIEPVDKPQPQRKRKSPSRGESQEMVQLRAKLDKAQKRIVLLEEQMEELLAVPEDVALLEQRNHYETRIETLEEQTRQLTDQLAIAEPRSRGSNDDSLPLLQYISRAAAAYEKKPLQDEIQRLKSVIASRDALIKSKDQELHENREAFEGEKKELDLMKADLEFELKAEIERNKLLTEKARQTPHLNGLHTPGSATHGKPGIIPVSSVNTTKHSAVVSFYEDLTNVLVPDIKFEPGKYFNKDDKTFQCVYTYLAPSAEDGGEFGRSLNFLLRNHLDLASEEAPSSSEPSPLVTSMDQLRDYMEYTPLHLDKEPPDFRDNLGFFTESFRFERNQLSVFYMSLGKQLKSMVEGPSQDDAGMGSEL